MTRTTDSLPPSSLSEWRHALTGFRERARRLFDAQRERIEFLEAVLADQMAQVDAAVGAGQPADYPDGTAATSLSPSQPTPPTTAALEERDSLRAQLAQCRKLLNARADELKQLRMQLASQAGESGVDIQHLHDQLAEVRLERDELVSRVAESERKLGRAQAADADQVDELRRRFETAVQEIRELKAKNHELEQRADRGARVREVNVAVGAGFDWEQQKQQLMQQLETDFSPSDPAAQRERLTIEGTIRITDQVIAEKDRQIAELQELLNEQSTSIGNTAVGAHAIAEMLNQNDLVREERENLANLQTEWREKLRKAEIDLSVERAKLARDRVELDERLQVLEREREAFASAGGTNSAGQPAKKTSRWLSRLGLKEDE